MKKSTLIFAATITTALSIFFISCGPSQEEIEETNAKNSIKITKQTKSYGKTYPDLSVVEYDSCEYVLSHVYYGEAITHKGNCKYCKQRNNNNLIYNHSK